LLFNNKAEEFAPNFDPRIQQIIARQSLTLMKSHTKTDVYVVRLSPGPYEMDKIRVTGTVANIYY